MKMVDMKRSKKSDGMAMPANEGYDHSVHLNHEHMKKLGVHDSMEVGDKMHIMGHAHVTHVSEDEDGKRSATLQIRKMHMQHADETHTDKETKMHKGAKAMMDKALEKRGKATEDDEDDDMKAQRAPGYTGGDGDGDDDDGGY